MSSRVAHRSRDWNDDEHKYGSTQTPHGLTYRVVYVHDDPHVPVLRLHRRHVPALADLSEVPKPALAQRSALLWLPALPPRLLRDAFSLLLAPRLASKEDGLLRYTNPSATIHMKTKCTLWRQIVHCAVQVCTLRLFLSAQRSQASAAALAPSGPRFSPRPLCNLAQCPPCTAFTAHGDCSRGRRGTPQTPSQVQIQAHALLRPKTGGTAAER